VDGRARAAAAGGAANVMIYNPQHRGAKGSVATNGGRGIGTPWPLSGFLERYPMEFLVHTWDLAQATHQSAHWMQIWYAMRWNQRGSSLPWPGGSA
jgi:hypothetical protein